MEQEQKSAIEAAGLKVAENEFAELTAKANKVLRIQLAISVGVAGLFLIQGIFESLSALYGGLATVVTAWFLSRGVKRASELAAVDPKKSMLIMYAGAVQRFLLVGALLAIGIGLIELDPIGVCAGFAIAQIGYLAGSRRVDT